MKKYLITLFVGFAAAFGIAYSKDILAQTDLKTIFHILTDSFCVPAVMIMGIGSLVFVSNEGGFDALSYGLTSFFDLFRKEKKNKFRTFYDYKESRAEKSMPFAFMLISGLVFVALTVIFLLLYNKYA